MAAKESLLASNKDSYEGGINTSINSELDDLDAQKAFMRR